MAKLKELDRKLDRRIIPGTTALHKLLEHGTKTAQLSGSSTSHALQYARMSGFLRQ